MIALLGAGLLAAFVVDQTASSQAEAGPHVIAEPAAKPVEVPVVAEAPKPAPQPETQKTPAPVEAAAPAPVDGPKPEVAASAPLPAGQPTVAPQPKIAVIPSDDPRWAVAAAGNATAIAALNTATQHTAPLAPDDTAVAAFAETEPQISTEKIPIPTPKPVNDPIVTAAIDGKAAAARVPMPSDPISASTGGSEKVQEQARAETTRQAKIRTAVKMRSGPADEASVVTVVPANATVALVGCKSWCEIVFNDRRGFVYKGFIK